MLSAQRKVDPTHFFFNEFFSGRWYIVHGWFLWMLLVFEAIAVSFRALLGQTLAGIGRTVIRVAMEKPSRIFGFLFACSYVGYAAGVALIHPKFAIHYTVVRSLASPEPDDGSGTMRIAVDGIPFRLSKTCQCPVRISPKPIQGFLYNLYIPSHHLRLDGVPALVLQRFRLLKTRHFFCDDSPGRLGPVPAQAKRHCKSTAQEEEKVTILTYIPLTSRTRRP